MLFCPPPSHPLVGGRGFWEMCLCCFVPLLPQVGRGGGMLFCPPSPCGALGVAQINKSSKRMHKTSQVRTLNKYIGGQVRSKLTLVFSVVFCLALLGFYVRGCVDWKTAAMH